MTSSTDTSAAADSTVCSQHGPMQGGEFVDGYRNGRSFGEYRVFCVPCRDREEAEKYPYRGNPKARQLRQERINAKQTLRETADTLGVDFMLINDIQMGKVEAPDDATFDAWITAIRAAARDGRAGEEG
jgi:hypothetical protein